MTDTCDLNTWLDSYAFTSFTKAQQESFKALERFALFNYRVACDVLEAGMAHTRAALGARAALGTQALADLLQKQAELGAQLSEQLRVRAQEFTALAAEVQESVGSFVSGAANSSGAANLSGLANPAGAAAQRASGGRKAA